MVRGYVWIICLSFVTYGVTTSSSCTRCSDFNRYDNASIACPITPNQCGVCKYGFRQTDIPDDGSCEKIQPPEMRQWPPASVYVSVGEEVNLPCSFRPKDRVDCVWLRRGFHLEINNRYSYKNSLTKGMNTSDCSIIISNFKTTDIGEWQCGSLADSNSEGVMSTETKIDQKENFIEKPEGNSIVDLGDNVTLNCTFDKDVDCVWLRNNFHLEISNRYAFVNNGSGRTTTDCSIRITNVSSGDFGEWQCGSMADSQKEGILSEKVIIKSKNDTYQTNEHPTTQKQLVATPQLIESYDTTMRSVDRQQTTSVGKVPSTQPSVPALNPLITKVAALDPVLVGFIIVIILLAIFLAISVVMLVFYKCYKKAGYKSSKKDSQWNGQKEIDMNAARLINKSSLEGP